MAISWRRRWTRRALLVAALMLAGLAAPGAGLARSKGTKATVLRVATLLPQGTSWMRELNRMATRLRRRTQGRVRLRFYPGAIKGDERDIVRLLTQRRLEGAALTGVGLGILVPQLRILDVPLLLADGCELTAARRAVTPTLRRAFRRRGFELAAWSAVGWVYLFTSRPLRHEADLGRLRIWSWKDDPLAGKSIGALGLRGIRLGVTGVLAALQTGMVDTVYGSPYTVLALQWHPHLRYRIPLRVTHASAAVIFDRRALARLNVTDRRLLGEESALFQRRHLALSERDNRRASAQLRRQGIRSSGTSAPVLRAVRRRLLGLHRRLRGGAFGAKLWRAVVAAKAACP